MAEPGENTLELTAETSGEPASNTPASKTSAGGAVERPDQLNPLSWEVPALCKDCNKLFRVPFRHFQAGVVFHCPHCHGSYVPTSAMYRQIRDAFATFEARMKQTRDQESLDNYETEYARFIEVLEGLARAMRPAGKMVRRHGIAAMFT